MKDAEESKAGEAEQPADKVKSEELEDGADEEGSGKDEEDADIEIYPKFTGRTISIPA